jgi:raffinose/stachyose/melibiose transport system substrate-binding protein
MAETEDGSIYGVPYTMNSMGIWYNMDKMNELGLEPAETYDELLTLYEAIENAGETPMMLPNKTPWTIWQLASRRMGQLFEQSGRDFDRVYGQIAGGEVSSADVPEIRQTAERILDMNRYGQADSFGTDFFQASESFVAGKSVMFFQGTWVNAFINQKNTDTQFELHPFPADTKEDSRVSVNFDISHCVSQDAQSPDLAKVFIEFLGRQEVAQEFTDIDGSIPLVKGVELSSRVMKPLHDAVAEDRSYLAYVTKYPGGYTDQLADLVAELIISEDTQAFYTALDETIREFWGN